VAPGCILVIAAFSCPHHELILQNKCNEKKKERKRKKKRKKRNGKKIRKRKRKGKKERKRKKDATRTYEAWKLASEI
jgi:hypothetical protein